MHSANTTSIDEPPPLERLFDVKPIDVTPEPAPRLDDIVDKCNTFAAEDSGVEYPSIQVYPSEVSSNIAYLQNIPLCDKTLILVLEGDPDPFDYICSKIKYSPKNPR